MSNNVLAILLVFAIFLSVLSTFTGISKLGGITGFATNTSEVNLTVAATTDFSLPMRAIDMGTLSIGQSNATKATGNPYPWLVQNDGSVFINITVNSGQLFATQAAASNYYMFNCTANETTCGTGSATTNTQMPISSAVAAIGLLNYSDATDEVALYVGVTVPPGESSGTKGAVVTLTSVQS